jgi:hypothetical protein
VRAGIEYLFVSNSDNLGATLDVDLLAYFAESGKAFLMEARHARARPAAAVAGCSALQVAWAPRSFAAGHLRLRARTSLGVPGLSSQGGGGGNAVWSVPSRQGCHISSTTHALRSRSARPRTRRAGTWRGARRTGASSCASPRCAPTTTSPSLRTCTCTSSSTPTTCGCSCPSCRRAPRARALLSCRSSLHDRATGVAGCALMIV